MIYAVCVDWLDLHFCYKKKKKVHSLEACWKWILLTEAFEAKCDTSSRKLYSVLFLAQAYFYRIKDQMSDSLQPFFLLLHPLGPSFFRDVLTQK